MNNNVESSKDTTIIRKITNSNPFSQNSTITAIIRGPNNPNNY